jgi:membrane-associated phospholipid phosphatase
VEGILELRSPGLTLVFRAFTSLGDGPFLMAAIPLAYWLWRKDAVARVTLVLLLSAVLNDHLKNIFVVPRPFMAPGSTVEALIKASGWSMPSGHAQSAAVLWGSLAWEIRRRWAFAAAACIASMVALSRVYLGVHYPVDVLVGAAIGLATVVVWYAAVGLAPRAMEKRTLTFQIAAPVVAVAVWLWLIPFTTAQGTLPAGAALGASAVLAFWIGICLDRRFLGYAPPGTWRGRIAIALLGLATLAVLRFALGWALAALSAPAWLQSVLVYAAIGAWISLGGPALFMRLGLATTTRSQAHAQS